MPCCENAYGQLWYSFLKIFDTAELETKPPPTELQAYELNKLLNIFLSKNSENV